MIIPCIDLMGGKVVQLVQGQKKAIELESVDEVLARFEGFDLIHVIDLDAAKGIGQNDALVEKIASRRRTRVGGGVRSLSRAQTLIDQGADQVIVGSAAYQDGSVNLLLLESLANTLGMERVTLAIDCKAGNVAIHGWDSTMQLTPEEAILQSEGACGSYLCTYVDKEGTMEGPDMSLFQRVRQSTSRTVVVAGGIGKLSEVVSLCEMGVDVALGMSIYTGAISLNDLRLLNS